MNRLTKKGSVPYRINAPRRVVMPMLEPLKNELDRMLDLKVIRPVEEPTDWWHPIVIVPKPNSHEIRICLDLTKLNAQVERELYELPSISESLAKLNGKCQVMSKLDFNSGYWQLPFDETDQLKVDFEQHVQHLG